jgi:hypothetical protein
LFRGPADRRWWHVELGDDAASVATIHVGRACCILLVTLPRLKLR